MTLPAYMYYTVSRDDARCLIARGGRHATTKVRGGGPFVHGGIAPSLPAWRKCMTTAMQSMSTVSI
jgi:hypothetical protein